MASKARGLKGGGSPLYLHHPFAFLGHPSKNPVCSLPRWSCPRAWLVSRVRGPACDPGPWELSQVWAHRGDSKLG